MIEPVELVRRDMNVRRVAILGVGLIGGSIGKALRQIADAPEVVGWDASPESLMKAIELGAIDLEAPTFEEAVAEADLVIIATPITFTVSLIQSIATIIGSEVVVTDVGSTKERICSEADKVLRGSFVGGHPMAGSEQRGVQASRSDLLNGANWLITPTELSSHAAIERVCWLAHSVNARVRLCSPSDHDSMVSALSHLPHLLAYSLSQTASEVVPDEWKDIAAGSFRDCARVALSDPDLWTRILMDNRKTLIANTQETIKWLEQAENALKEEDQEALHQLLFEAHTNRKKFR